ncbi:MFS transporter [Tabrizicola sp. YIM 78059]|uniref:MFS transporter n=1 Tax=Tabrizicola sp. YIM 78059 TaxID=2529861 RepID=UPI0010A99A41|nr:MFS transporter [Tabrizicola sp. YIM 78059]
MTDYIAFLRQNLRWLMAGFLLTWASSFGQTFFISVFAGEIRAAFDLSHGAWGALYAGATMASAAVMIYSGGLTDRFRVRHISLVILCGLAASSLLMATAPAVWMLWVAVFLMRLTGQGMMGHTAMVAMSRWFAASRGRAVAFAGLGVAAGEALLPITAASLMLLIDWRSLWLLAGLVPIVLMPVLHVLLRQERTPQSFAAEQHSAGMGGRHWTRGEVLRHWLFWLLVPAILGPPAWITAFFFHQVHLAEVKGWAHVTIVALFPVFTISGIASMLATGWAVDRFGAARLVPVYLLPLALGYLAIAHATTPGAAAAAMVLMGLSVGANATLSTAIWAEFFGNAHLGRIRAMTGAVMVLGSAIGPGVTGLLIDAGHDLPEQAVWIAGYFLLAAVLAGSGALVAQRLLLADDAGLAPCAPLR